MTNIEEHKQLWRDCEQERAALREQIKVIGKRQRDSSRALREYMEQNAIEALDCGDGWTMVRSEVESVAYTEDACERYLSPDQMESIKRDCTRVRKRYKVSRTP